MAAILNPLFETAGGSLGAASGWVFSDNCPSVIVDPVGFCSGPGYPQLDGVDTGHTGTQFQLGREDPTEMEYSISDTFVRVISQTTQSIPPFAESLDVRFHKKLSASADTGTWAVEVWVAGVLEATNAVEPGDDATVTTNISMVAHRNTSVLIEVKLTQQASVQLGAFTLAGKNTNVIRATSLSDPTGASYVEIGQTVGHTFGWFVAVDSDGELEAYGWAIDPSNTRVVEYTDACRTPDGNFLVVGQAFSAATVDVYNSDGTVGASVARDGTGPVDWAFWALYDANGDVVWAVAQTWTDNVSIVGWSVSCYLNSCVVTSDGRAHIAGTFRARGNLVSVPSFNGVDFPDRGAPLGGNQHMSNFWVELDLTDGSGIDIHTLDSLQNNTFGAASAYSAPERIQLALSPDESIMFWKVAQTYNTDGTGTVYNPYVGRGHPDSFQIRTTNTYGDATTASRDIVAAFTIDGAPLHAVSLKANGSFFENANLNSGKIAVDADGNVFMSPSSSTASNGADIDRDPVAYDAPDVYDAGQDKVELIKLDTSFGKPSVDGFIAELLSHAGLSRGNFDSMELACTSDGHLLVALTWYTSASAVDFVGAPETMEYDHIMAKVSGVDGSLLWTARMSPTPGSFTSVQAFATWRTGPRASEVVSLLAASIGSTPTEGVLELDNVTIGFDVSASWAVTGMPNGLASQLVVASRDLSGNLVPAKCWSLFASGVQPNVLNARSS